MNRRGPFWRIALFVIAFLLFLFLSLELAPALDNGHWPVPVPASAHN